LQVITVVGLVSYLFFRNEQKAVEDIATQSRQEIAVRVEQDLRSYLVIPHLVNQNNAVAINQGQLDVQNLPGLERFFWHQLQVFDTVAFVGLAFENKDIVGAERTDDGSLVVRVSTEANGHDFRTYATNSAGDRLKLLYHLPGFNPPARPWYKVAVAAGKPVWSAIYSNTAGLTAYLGASMPLYSKQGKLQGVFQTSINLSQIGSFLQSLKVGKTGQVFIIERSGLLVATSTGDKPFHRVPKAFGAERVKAIDSSNLLTRSTMQYLTKNFTAHDSINIQDSKLLEFKVNGQREFLQVSPFRDKFGLDWLIVVVIPESDFTGQITANTQNAIQLTLVALIVAITLGVLTAQWISGPILRVSQASKAIARGNLDQHVEPSRIIEIETLANSFNSMAGQLQASFAALRQSEGQNRAIVEALPDLLFRAKADGTYIDNPVGQNRLKAIFAGNRSLKGVNIADSLPPQLAQQRMQAIRQALQTGQLQVYEQQLLVNDQAIAEEVRVVKIADDEVLIMVRDISERKRAENERKQLQTALQESEARFRGVVEQATVGIALVTLSGQFSLFNRRYCELLGYSESELYQLTNLDVTHPDDRAATIAAMGRLLAGETSSFSIDKRYTRKNGQIQWGNLTCSPIYNQQGELQYLLGVLVDISERKQVEENLRIAEENYRSIVENALEGIFQSTPEGRFISVNPAMARIHGYASSEEMLNSIADIGRQTFVNPAEREELKRLLNEQGQVKDFEYQIHQKDGGIAWIEENTRVVRDAEGNALYYEGIIQNITDRKRQKEILEAMVEERTAELAKANAALQISEAELRGLFTAMDDVIIVYDRQGTCLKVASTNPNLLIMSLEEMVGRNIYDIVPRDKADQRLQLIQQVIETRQTTSFEYSLEIGENTPSGKREVWFAANLSPLSDDTVIMVARDITERKQVEKALQASEAELRALFAAMTDVVIVKDIHGRYCKIAPTNPSNLLVPGSSLLGLTEHDILPKAQADCFVDHIQQVLSTQQMMSIDYCLTIENREVWFTANVSPLAADTVVWVARDITERKRIEDELQAQQAFLRQIVDAVPNSIFVKDREGRFVVVNQSAAGIYGVTVEEMLGKTDLDFNRNREEVKRYLADNQEVMTTRETKIFPDQAIYTRQGELRWYQTSISPFIDADGEVQGIIGSLADITDRKQAEAALQESERKYRTIFENSQVGIGRTRLEDGLFLDANERLVEILGFNSTADLMGWKSSSGLYVNPEDRKQIIDELKQQGGVRDYEVNMRRFDGSTFWALLSVQLSLDKSSAEFFITDITDRKQAEAALRQSEERNRAILLAIPDLMTFVSAEGIYLDSIRSNAVVDLVPTDINPVGKHMAELLPPEVVTRQIEAIQQALATKEVQVYEQQLEFEGQHQYEELRVVPWGKDAALIMIRNITDRKQAEEALRLSELKYRNIFENSQVGIGRSRPEDGLILAANQRLAEILGFDSAADLISQRCTTEFYWNSGDRQRVLVELEQQGEVRDLELPIRRQDNSMLWGMFSLKHNLEESCFEFVITDISDRKQAEAALQNSLTQLALANQEIKSLNQRLESENLRLSAELSVARQLQQMILPREQELEQIEGLDIAGFMEPADEVGGDYYDVLQYNGGVKIGIGDVTGHGLESGVLMIMVQTAVRTLLANNETDPNRFLSTINRVIYDNAQRMNSIKNLSLALLDYQAGQIKLSGQHEEVLVVRATGQIERIDTVDLGFFLGLVPDISEFIAQTEIQLQLGDGVVLYTDGITEAQNTAKEYYGLERLCQVVSQHWQQSAAEIRQAIVEDVQTHIGQQKVYDDITLLVLKQK
jgi:PAS domain S-box-containing protein